MVEITHDSAAPTPKQFFVSRAGADGAFGQWVGRLIASQGGSHVLQDEHFGHQDFMGAMHEALSSGARVVALLSQAYLDSDNCLKEATTALTGDPLNRQQRLVPLRIAPCVPGGMLANVAFTDLLEHRRQSDASMLAWRILTALGFEKPSLANLPPPPTDALLEKVQITPEKFRLVTGYLAPRTELLEDLARTFRSTVAEPASLLAAVTNSRHVIQAVSGMGGVGKTVLALEFARRHAQDYEGVWWIESETPQQLMQDLAALGARLEPAVGSLTQTDLPRAVARTLELIEQGDFEKPWLLVYDNVEKPGDLDARVPAANAHVLVTSRWSDWHGISGKIDVGLFGEDEAVDFLCARADRAADREAAAELANVLGYLPLALDHAASYCRRRNRSFAHYLDDVLPLIKEAPRAGSTTAQYPGSVYGTLKLALQRITEGDEAKGIAAVPEAAQVMAFSAYVAPDLIPRDLLAAAGDSDGEVRIDAALAALADVSLVKLGETAFGGPAFSTHRLVQLVTRDLVRAEDAEAQIAGAVLAVVDQRFPEASWEYALRAECDELAAHAGAILEHAERQGLETSEAAGLHRKIGNLLEARAAYSEAEPHFERALAITSRVHGSESAETSGVLHDLANLYQSQGRYEDAEPLLQRSLAIKEHALGPEHPSTSATLHELARLYRSQARYAAAEPLLQRSLAICEKTLGPEHPHTAATLHQLGRLYEAQGRYEDAEPALRRSLAISEKTLGPAHPSTSAALHELARLYQSQDRYADAAPLLHRSLEIDERALGPEHPSTAATLQELARLYRSQARYAAAEPILQRALAIRERSVGSEHPSTATVLLELGRLHEAQGRYAEAEPLLQRALSITQASLGEQHPSTAATLHVIGQMYENSGRHGEASPHVVRALAIAEKSLGSEHPLTIIIRESLARIGAGLASEPPATSRPKGTTGDVASIDDGFAALPPRADTVPAVGKAAGEPPIAPHDAPPSEQSALTPTLFPHLPAVYDGPRPDTDVSPSTTPGVADAAEPKEKVLARIQHLKRRK